MVEVEGEGISVWCRLRSGWGGPRCVVGLGVGWSWRWDGGRGKSRFSSRNTLGGEEVLAAPATAGRLGMTIHGGFGRLCGGLSVGWGGLDVWGGWQGAGLKPGRYI